MRFRIDYKDPETQEDKTVYAEFHDTQTITARQWAEDYGYTLADKGYFTVTEQTS